MGGTTYQGQGAGASGGQDQVMRVGPTHIVGGAAQARGKIYSDREQVLPNQGER